MKRTAQEITYFFSSQQFEDGIRITIAVLLPALISSYLNYFNLGLTMSLGALCVSLVDSPGPIVHRKNSMLYCLLFVFAVAIVTGFARLNIFTMGLEILMFGFFFSMFTVYGSRAGFVGNAALLIMVLTMDSAATVYEVIPNSFFIFCGGLWYMLISLVTYQVRPYRTAQRALGECIRELASFLSIKADFYDCDTNLDDDYQRLLAQQIVVSEKQDAVRELLFKTREIVKESTPLSRKLVLTFVDTVDLFEDITAIYYDYRIIRKQYEKTPVLKHMSDLIKQMAEELDHIGIAIQSNIVYKKQINYKEELIALKNQIDRVGSQQTDGSNLVLKKALVNFRKMAQRFNDIMRYFDDDTAKKRSGSESEHKLFVAHQSLDPKLFLDNLSFSSSVYRHSLRVAIASIVGFIIAKSIAAGHHSYWIIMTIAFMLKPAFSLTKRRNYERIVGTVTGGVIGVLILAFIHNNKILFALMVLLMIATYSFQRVKYLVAVICMTPFIFILFKFLGVGFYSLAKERVLDTAIGCVLAFLASYLLFPDWESEQLTNHLQKMLKANSLYLQKLLEQLLGKNMSMTEYRLARKEVYVSSANLSAAFQRMLSEPKSKQKNKKEIHQFVVLNHILFSNIATVSTSLMAQNTKTYPEEIIRPAKKALLILCESLQKFDNNCNVSILEITGGHSAQQRELILLNAEEELLKEQLEYIHRMSIDIARITDQIISEGTIPQPARTLSAQVQ